MVEIFVVRHAVTDWNEEKRFQGHSDIPINKAGREEIQRYKLPLEWEEALLLASPLNRAQETAELLSGKEPIIEPELIEMNWGRWEGRRYDQLAKELGDELKQNEDRGLDFRPEEGESPREVCERLTRWFKNLTKGENKKIVIVTHKGVIRAMMALAFNWDMMGKAPAKLQRYAGHHFLIKEDGRLECRTMNMALKIRANG